MKHSSTKYHGSPRLEWSQALLWILLSTITVSGSAILCLLYFQHVKHLRIHDPKFTILAIVQTGPDKEQLKTVYLAELLDLSLDRPTNLYRFNSKEAKKKLLASPLIKEAQVKKIIPNTVYVDYTVRKPLAFLGDYSNTAVDSEGVLFPFKPYFTPKRLPEMVLGLSSLDVPEDAFLWGTQLKGHKAELALHLLQLLTSTCCSEKTQLRKIDVSKAYTPSYGQRQIVVVLEDQIEIDKGGRSLLVTYPRVLRLSTEGYAKELSDYLILRKYLMEQESKNLSIPETEMVFKAPPKIIDLRIPRLAFISKN